MNQAPVSIASATTATSCASATLRCPQIVAMRLVRCRWWASSGGMSTPQSVHLFVSNINLAPAPSRTPTPDSYRSASVPRTDLIAAARAAGSSRPSSPRAIPTVAADHRDPFIGLEPLPTDERDPTAGCERALKVGERGNGVVEEHQTELTDDEVECPAANAWVCASATTNSALSTDIERTRPAATSSSGATDPLRAQCRRRAPQGAWSHRNRSRHRAPNGGVRVGSVRATRRQRIA